MPIYNWQKLSPVEFQQLQEYANCVPSPPFPLLHPLVPSITRNRVGVADMYAVAMLYVLNNIYMFVSSRHHKTAEGRDARVLRERPALHLQFGGGVPFALSDPASASCHLTPRD